jgi:hypothetical protein
MSQNGRNQTQNDKRASGGAPAKKRITLPVVIVLVAIAVIAAISVFGGRFGGGGKDGGAAAVVDADLVIPVSEISATAKFYPVVIDGTKLEVIAVKAPDGTIRKAFYTCQV